MTLILEYHTLLLWSLWEAITDITCTNKGTCQYTKLTVLTDRLFIVAHSSVKKKWRSTQAAAPSGPRGGKSLSDSTNTYQTANLSATYQPTDLPTSHWKHWSHTHTHTHTRTHARTRTHTMQGSFLRSTHHKTAAALWCIPSAIQLKGSHAGEFRVQTIRAWSIRHTGAMYNNKGFVHCPITSKFCIPLVLVVEYKPVPCTNNACMQPSVCIYTHIFV